MCAADKPIMGSDLRFKPIAPASEPGDGDRRLPEFGRPRQQPIGFACGVLGDAAATKIDLGKIGDERRAAEKPAFDVASAERDRILIARWR